MTLVPTDYDVALKAEREIVDHLFKFEHTTESAEVLREQDVRSLAKSLFVTYFDPEERDEIFFAPDTAGKNVVEEYCVKAEKIYNFFGCSLTSSQRCLDFFKSLEPKIAKSIVEWL